MKRKFKVGDKVAVLVGPDHRRPGVIVALHGDPDKYFVEFENYISTKAGLRKVLQHGLYEEGLMRLFNTDKEVRI